MANPPISVFTARSDEPVVADLAGWKKVEGNPSMKRWRQYVSDDGSMICAWWEGMPGTYHATYDAWEFVHLLEGKIIITPDGGEPRQVGVGDTFVIENGFKGTWEIKEKALKVCAFTRK
jgi:uncharacterized cupin superfamily protein